MTLDFQTTLSFYNNVSEFPFGDTADRDIQITDLQLPADYKNSEYHQIIELMVNCFNSNDFQAANEANIIPRFFSALLIATINRYRATFNLPAFRIAQSLHPLAFSETDLVNVDADDETKANLTPLKERLQNNEYHSGNLSFINDPDVQTNLFLQQSLIIQEPIKHVLNMTYQNDDQPDYVEFGEPWTMDEIFTVQNWTAYIADVVATIATTWDGKIFLTQTSENDNQIYIDADNLVANNQTIFSLIAASIDPTIVD